LLFVWHTGEEEGLYGSEWYTDHPTVPRDSIVAQLNMDMVGRGSSADNTGVTKEGQRYHGNPNYVQLVGSRRLSSELGDLAAAVNEAGLRPIGRSRAPNLPLKCGGRYPLTLYTFHSSRETATTP